MEVESKGPKGVAPPEATFSIDPDVAAAEDHQFLVMQIVALQQRCRVMAQLIRNKDEEIGALKVGKQESVN